MTRIFTIISFLLLSTNVVLGACDFTTAENVIIIPGGNHNADPAYTQVYLLTDEDGFIVSVSATGDFGTQNFGSYNAYAFNYETANSPSILPALGVDIANINDGCGLFSVPLPLTVCETSVLTTCEDSGDDIIVALNPDFNNDPNYSQLIVIVDDVTGNILYLTAPSTTLGTASFTTTAVTGDLTNGNYSAYAVNHENSETLIGLGLIIGNPWSGNFAGACASSVGPVAIFVDDCTTCTADAGLTNAVTSDGSNNDYVLCWNESITFSNTSYILPGSTTNEGFGYAVYASPMPGAFPDPTDTDFIEYIVGTGASASLTLSNDGSYTPPFINNPTQTIYLYPVTFDDTLTPAIDQDGDNCIALGNLITITFLNEVNVTSVQDCLSESGVFTISGGYPEFFAANYNFTSTGAGTLSSPTLANSGGAVTIGNLAIGDIYGLDIIDDNNCPASLGNILYPSNLNYDSIIVTPPSCSYTCDASVTVYSANASTYSFDGITFGTNQTNLNLCSGNLSVSIEDNGCVVDSIIAIAAPDTILITSANDTTICIDGSVNLFASASGGTGVLNYFWDNSIGTSTLGVSPSVTTIFDVFVLDDNGCSSDTNSIQVSLLDPIIVDLDDLDSICLGESITLFASALGGNGSYSYNWTNNQGTGWSATGNSINVTPTIDTEYYVSVTDGCSTPASNEAIQINVNPLPEVIFSADTLEGCNPLEVNFTNNTILSGTDCLWTINGSTSTDCESVTEVFEDVGCYDISLSVSSISGCTNVTTYNDLICVYEYPIADFVSSDTIVSIYNPSVTFNNTSIDNFSNEWILNNSSSSSIDFSYTFEGIPSSTEVCLLVTNQYSCENETCQIITVEDEMTIYVPNTFTPNGDNDNDLFHPIMNENLLTSYELLVFNRWGELIFKALDYSTKWDGTYLGNPCQEDTYVWVIKYQTSLDVSNRVAKGHINLIR